MKKISKLLGVVSLIILAATFIRSSNVDAQGSCPANTADLGQVTGSFNIPVSGTYRVWTRMMPDTTASNNSYTLEVDGTQCGITVGDTTLAQNTWTWVDHRDGNTNSKINMTLSAGTHTFTMYGREAGVKVDKIVFSGVASCTPTGTGDNCATAPDDNENPTVSITSPSASATVSNTVQVRANAGDNRGVSQVAFYLDGSSTAFATDNSSPYEVNWVTSGTTNGPHTLTAIATDTSGNTTTSSGVAVTVSNTQPDTTAPTTSITSPTNGQSVSGTITISANASDAVGVTRVELLIDGSLAATDNSSPYSFSWNTATVSNGTHTLRTRAYDSANNGPGQSSVITVTVNNTSPTPKEGDVNGDGLVNIFDLTPMFNNWNRTGANRSQGDLTGDGIVNIFDLSQVLTRWGS